ncbi:hypothetical protein ABT131_11795 [Streptomyces sp900105245]|uniref:hypothetical protein n=1 Tax=Streptomyces sp. 900105245 TaxID=3154379 RepID=UPI00093D80B7
MRVPAEDLQGLRRSCGDPGGGGQGAAQPVLETLAPRLAALRYDVPDQDLRIPLGRMPTAPRSGFIMTSAR